ncbi:MAG TPA: hypothetical protein VK988_14555, partial [Acidimicrobiales bacterium]|nr:hypothetical protein [Acidimicrobiales bacterium]
QRWPEELRTALVGLSGDLGELRQDLRGHPLSELRGTVTGLEAQLTLLTQQLAAQPAPGAAVAMVAAGLAERFEERTQALTELLEGHAAYVRLTWERIEGMLGGGAFDELAVGEALEHVIDNQELMADSMEGVRRMLESLWAAGPQVAPDYLSREMLEALGAGMDSVVARVDDVRRRLADLDRAVEAQSHEVGPAPEAPEPASLLGRRASNAGRRLATDLGRRSKGRSPRPPDRGDSQPSR